MNDNEIDKHLKHHLSGDLPREAFRQQVLHDSTTEFVHVHRRSIALRSTKLAAAAVLIAGFAFLCGRLSMPPTVPDSKDDTSPVVVESDSVNVPNELVVWLDAARLFKQLGMQDRMARAVERAGRLLPVDTLIVDGKNIRVFAAGTVKNRKESDKLMDLPGPQTSVESVNQILAQSFGD